MKITKEFMSLNDELKLRRLLLGVKNNINIEKLTLPDDEKNAKYTLK